MVGQRLEQVDALALAFGGEAAADPPARVDDPRPRRAAVGVEAAHRAAVERARPRRLVEIQHLGRAGLEHRLARPGARTAGARVVMVADRHQPRVAGVLGQMVHRHRGVRQIVEQRLHAVMEERRPVLHALMLAPRADRSVERIVEARRAKSLAIALPEPRDAVGVEDHLRGRRQRHAVDLLHRALGGDLKAPRAVEHVAEQIEPNRQRGAGGKDVHDAAAHREIARLAHHLRAVIAHARQIPQQRVEIDLAAHRGGEAGAQHRPARGRALDRGVDRGQQHGGAVHALGQQRQRRHALRRDLGRRRHAVIGQAIPRRIAQQRQAARHHAQRLGHGGGAAVVAGDVDHRAVRARGDLGQQRGVIALRRAADSDGAGVERLAV